MLKYTLIRSNRKTICIEITADAKVLVRAPLKMPVAEIDRFVASRERWAKEKLSLKKDQKKVANQAGKLTNAELRALADKALRYIPERVAYYAPKVGVTYGRITIRNQKTRWGSCSSKGNLNFNCLLMLAPPDVIDSVVVHELCHRKEMNHSPRFYAEVLRVFPRYYECNGWLKEHGGELLGRM